MTSDSNVEQEDSPVSPPASPVRDSESSEGENLYAGLTDEEAWQKYLSTKWKDSSKKPMKEPLTAPWGLTISGADLEKLKTGFKSRDMDDKWDVLNEEPDKDGNVSIHILRSWLQEDCYILHIVLEPNSDNTGDSANIYSITWEGNKGGLRCDGEQAKKEAVMVSRWILKCEFATLPDYPSSVMWQSSAYKKIDAE